MSLASEIARQLGELERHRDQWLVVSRDYVAHCGQGHGSSAPIDNGDNEREHTLGLGDSHPYCTAQFTIVFDVKLSKVLYRVMKYSEAEAGLAVPVMNNCTSRSNESIQS